MSETAPYDELFEDMLKPLTSIEYTPLAEPIMIIEKLIGCGVKPFFIHKLTEDIIPKSLQKYIYGYTIDRQEIKELDQNYYEENINETELKHLKDGDDIFPDKNDIKSKHIELKNNGAVYSIKLHDEGNNEEFTLPVYDSEEVVQGFPYDIEIDSIIKNAIQLVQPENNSPLPSPPPPPPSPPQRVETRTETHAETSSTLALDPQNIQVKARLKDGRVISMSKLKADFNGFEIVRYL